MVDMIAVIKKNRFGLKSACFLSIGLAFLTACASKKNVDLIAQQQRIERDDVIYNEALANFRANRLDEATKKFALVETQHPFSQWGKKALIMESFTNYCNGKYTEAIEAAKRYLSQNPKDNDAAYANYLIGLSYFKQIPDITFDQKNAQFTADAMTNLLVNYPHSPYVADAKIKLRFAKEQLAQKEMRVGRYYQDKKNYIAALKRYRTVIEHYNDTVVTQEALYRLVEINFALGLQVEARTAAILLGTNYPNSIWYKNAYALLENGNVPMNYNKHSWLYKALSH